jgi:hypothetical protein
VGFVVDKLALGQVFSEYFGFPCQPSFHQLLHNHHLPSGAGTIGQQWPTYQVDSASPHPEKLKKKERKKRNYVCSTQHEFHSNPYSCSFLYIFLKVSFFRANWHSRQENKEYHLDQDTDKPRKRIFRRYRKEKESNGSQKPNQSFEKVESSLQHLYTNCD